MFLEKEDAVNLLCGIEESYKRMDYMDERGLKGLYSYSEKTGVFQWCRAEIESMEQGQILSLYTALKEIGKEDDVAIAEVLNYVTEKRCNFKCGSCGMNGVAMGDKYCHNCGKRLVFDFE